MKRKKEGLFAKQNKMRIGVDLDDVIVEFSKTFLDFYNKKKSTRFEYRGWTKYQFADSFGLDREGVNLVAEEFFNSNLFYELDFFKDSKKCLNQLSKKNQLYIVTSRPIRHGEKTKKFIEGNLPGVFNEIFYSDEVCKDHAQGKAEICKREQIEIIIEDNLEYALCCNQNKIKPIIFNRNWNKEYSNGILRAGDWNQISYKIKLLSTK